jgi:hypothetical protein
MAIKGGGLPAPHGAPTFLTSSVWSYAPLILVSVAALIGIRRLLSERVSHPIAISVTREQPHALAPAKAPVAPVPVTSAQEPKLGNVGRTFMPASFTKRYLQMRSRDHTEAEVTALLRPNIGRWMRMTAILRDARIFDDTITATLVAPGTDARAVPFTVEFYGEEEQHIAPIKPNSRISFTCEIVEKFNRVSLRNGAVV